MFQDVDASDCSREAGPFTAVLRSNCRLGGREEHVHVVDARSIYDAMPKEGSASVRGRRTALDLAVVRETLEKERTRPLESPRSDPVDAFTKDDISKGTAALASLPTH
eukprot:7659040-Pyramimonas_sp.AAC.1